MRSEILIKAGVSAMAAGVCETFGSLAALGPRRFSSYDDRILGEPGSARKFCPTKLFRLWLQDCVGSEMRLEILANDEFFSAKTAGTWLTC